MKEHPDINDALRTEGEAAVRARHDRAWKYQRNGKGGSAEQSDDGCAAPWSLPITPDAFADGDTGESNK